MSIATANTLALAILKVLGVDCKGVTSVSIQCAPGQLAEVTIKRAVFEDEVPGIVESLLAFDLYARPACSAPVADALKGF